MRPTPSESVLALVLLEVVSTNRLVAVGAAWAKVADFVASAFGACLHVCHFKSIAVNVNVLANVASRLASVAIVGVPHHRLHCKWHTLALGRSLIQVCS